MFRRLLPFLLLSLSLFAQQPAFRRTQHLQHGINTSEWFAQTTDYSVQRLHTYTTLDDIDRIKKMGFDHVRISIDAAVFECFRWNSNCDRVKALDEVVDRALNDDLAVMIDLHPTSEYKKEIATSEDAVQRAVIMWEKVAQHYSNRDPELVFFEVMNEPEGHDVYHWGAVEDALVHAIRRGAPAHTIIVAGANYSDIVDLVRLPEFADRNLIYNFHYYEPHTFTHQGASWGSAYWLHLKELPFPATAENIAPIAALQPDDLARWELTEYALANWNPQRIEAEMEFAADWAKRRNVPLICNEFGAFREFSKPEDRMRWISAVRTALEKNHIGWTMWDYRGGFGVVHVENGKTTEDPDVVKALGLRK